MKNSTQQNEPVVAVETPFKTTGAQISYSGPTVPETADVRSMAIAAGELHGKIYRDMLRRFDMAGRDELRFRRGLIRDMASEGAIRLDEVAALDEILSIVEVTGKDIDVKRLRQIFEQLVDRAGSPVAVSIAGIAVNSGGAQTTSVGGVARYWWSNFGRRRRSGSRRSIRFFRRLRGKPGLRLQKIERSCEMTQSSAPVAAGQQPARLTLGRICFDVGGRRICIPLGTGPTVPGADSNGIAVAAGEMHGKIYRELVRRFEMAGKYELRFRKNLIRDLASSGSIRTDEVPALHEIIDIAAKPGKDIDVDRLRRIFEQFVDTDGGPVAIALASIAVNSGGVQKSEGGEIAGADVGGGAAGGVLGDIGGAILIGAISSFGAATGQGVGG